MTTMCSTREEEPPLLYPLFVTLLVSPSLSGPTALSVLRVMTVAGSYDVCIAKGFVCSNSPPPLRLSVCAVLENHLPEPKGQRQASRTPNEGAVIPYAPRFFAVRENQ